MLGEAETFLVVVSWHSSGLPTWPSPGPTILSCRENIGMRLEIAGSRILRRALPRRELVIWTITHVNLRCSSESYFPRCRQGQGLVNVVVFRELQRRT